jgi:hypothetical protein
LLPVIIILSSAFIYQYFSASFNALTTESGNYVELAAIDSREDSLGMALVFTQPLPVRAVLGSGVILAFPIPLWGYIGPEATEYMLLKTWQGMYQLYLVPFFMAGLAMVVRGAMKKGGVSSAQMFVAIYVVLMLLAVGATSLETRHFGQFIPAMILLAAIPDTRQMVVRKRVKFIALGWISVLTVVHLAWAGLRYL